MSTTCLTSWTLPCTGQGPTTLGPSTSLTHLEIMDLPNTGGPGTPCSDHGLSLLFTEILLALYHGQARTMGTLVLTL
jgi:hypothetical protein